MIVEMIWFLEYFLCFLKSLNYFEGEPERLVPALKWSAYLKDTISDLKTISDSGTEQTTETTIRRIYFVYFIASAMPENQK